MLVPIAGFLLDGCVRAPCDAMRSGLPHARARGLCRD
jgi:hypothetical protein